MFSLLVFGLLLSQANGYANFLSHSRPSLRAGDKKSKKEVSLSSSRSDVSAPITLFCFAFTPRRQCDESMLKEVRQQMAQCDGYMFFTDEDAPGEPANDIIKIKVPRQPVRRKNGKWLWHRNMAALTPVWTYLLENNIVEKYDYTINVELDHFMRPTKVRKAILDYFNILREGSTWERSFAPVPFKELWERTILENMNVTNASMDISANNSENMQPVMLAFGNAFVFNSPMVKTMKKQWPLPGLADKHGCPSWEGWTWCEQDMVYPVMLYHFKPRIQMFGSKGCGKIIRSEKGNRFPLACWEFFQNPYQNTVHPLDEPSQLKAIDDIAMQEEGKGSIPSTVDRTIDHMALINSSLNDALWRDHKPRKLTDEEIVWEHYLPSKEIPIIHHVWNANVLKYAREKLGL